MFTACVHVLSNELPVKHIYHWLPSYRQVVVEPGTMEMETEMETQMEMDTEMEMECKY